MKLKKNTTWKSKEDSFCAKISAKLLGLDNHTHALKIAPLKTTRFGRCLMVFQGLRKQKCPLLCNTNSPGRGPLVYNADIGSPGPLLVLASIVTLYVVFLAILSNSIYFIGCTTDLVEENLLLDSKIHTISNILSPH